MFDLPPEWRPLFKADYGEAGHEMQLYSSQKGLVLLVPEKRQGRVIGAACVACKPLAIQGDETALRSLKINGEAIIVKPLNSPSSHLLLFSKPFHLTQRDSLPSLLEVQLKQLGKVHYTLRRIDGIKVDDNINSQEMFSDPSLALAFLRALSNKHEEKSVLGKDLTGEKFALPLSSVSTAFVVGGSMQQRTHALHLLAEEALASNSCVVVFDSRSAFNGLARPNQRDFASYSAFGLPAGSAGFAFKELSPAGNAFVRLSLFSPAEILSIFSLSPTQTECGKILGEALANVKTFSEALAFLAAAPYSQFTTRRAARLLSVMDASTPGLFASSSLLSSEVSSSIGKVFHVDLSQCNAQSQALYVMGLLRDLSTVNQKLFILFEQPAAEVKSAVEFALATFASKDACIAVHAEHEEDFPQLASADLLVEMVEDGAVASAAGQPPKRIELRPAYSQCSEV